MIFYVVDDATKEAFELVWDLGLGYGAADIEVAIRGESLMRWFDQLSVHQEVDFEPDSTRVEQYGQFLKVVEADWNDACQKPLISIRSSYQAEEADRIYEKLSAWIGTRHPQNLHVAEEESLLDLFVIGVRLTGGCYDQKWIDAKNLEMEFQATHMDPNAKFELPQRMILTKEGSGVVRRKQWPTAEDRKAKRLAQLERQFAEGTTPAPEASL